MLYAVLKTLSWLASHTPYKVLVKIGKGLGHLYWHIAKKQRIRAEETIRERLGYSRTQAKATIKRLFVNLGISVMEMLYMPALNKDNIRGLVTFDHPEIMGGPETEKRCRHAGLPYRQLGMAGGCAGTERISPQRRGKTAAQQSVFRFYERIAKRGRAGNLRTGQQ